MARWLAVQQHARQQLLMHTYLQSAQTRVLPFSTTLGNVQQMENEHERLTCETRDAQGCYTVTRPQGQQIPVLIQPTQAAASDTHEVVPRIQLAQLNVHLENMGQNMRWQVRVENVQHISLWAQEPEKQKRKDDANVDDLAAAFDPAVTSKGPGFSATMADG